MSLFNTGDEHQQLVQSKELYQQIFHKSFRPAIIHDMYFNIHDVNEKALEEFGYSREEMLSLQIFDLHTSCELEHSLDVLKEMKEADNLDVLTKFKRKDGSVFTAKASPCKINLERTSLIHVHFEDIADYQEEASK